MKKLPAKKASPNKHLLFITALLFAFGLGLLFGQLQPSAIFALLVLVVVVITVLLGECFYLWQLAKRQELSKIVRVKRQRSLSEKEVQ